MNPGLRLLAAFVAAGAAGAVGTILMVPRAVMTVAMARLSDKGTQINAFRFAPRTTAASRGVVRPSPDLAYASCVYDLADGPLLVEIASDPAGGYVSVSVFDAKTDNFAVFDSTTHPRGIRFVLRKQDQPSPGRMQVVTSPTTRGIILDRRLAPTAAAFAAADSARKYDSCARL